MLDILKGIALILLGWGASGWGETPSPSCEAQLQLPARIVTRLQAPVRSLAAVTRTMEPLISAVDAVLVETELKREARLMLDQRPAVPDKGFQVYLATGRTIPNVMREVGRVRELTFRAAGEGTARPLDLDRFDDYYLQLICWDKRARRITGGYRLGKADEIIRAYGIDGLYVNTLVGISPDLVREFGERTLEVGRSFVEPEYQGGTTLGALWGGIAMILAENPHYNYLIGPVSVSGKFGEASRLVMSRFLMKTFEHPKAAHIEPRNPPLFNTRLTDRDVRELMRHLNSLDHLQQVVRLAERDPQARVPQLIKIYLELNVKFMGFNWDRDFNSLDGLIWTDLTELPFATHRKYMGEAAARSYRAANGLDSPP